MNPGTGIDRQGTVVRAGFTQQSAALPVAVRTSEPTVIPPTITFEAHPQYTAEAAQAHVQGTVVVRVCFTAAGTVRVLGVVQGLPFGLTEQALRVVESIRFVPGPRDFDTNVRVTFQLAGE
jgi:TonB family protein